MSQKNEPALRGATEATGMDRMNGSYIDYTSNQPFRPLSIRRTCNEESQSPEVQSAEPLNVKYTCRSFPVDALPGVLRDFVIQGSRSICCAADFLAVPLLAGMGTAIGRTRALEIKTDWVESTSLWVMLVGDPGTSKSPALFTAVRPLQDAQDDKYRTWISDTTTEAMAAVMQKNLRGLALIADELSGWSRRFDQYRSGRGADEQVFLSIWSGSDASIDRKGLKRPILLKRPFLSIIGGIQPGIVPQLITPERLDSGFASRFLFAWPGRVPRKYNTDVVLPEVKSAVQKVYDDLLDFDFDRQTPGNKSPQLLRLSRGGQAAWVEWIKQHQDEAEELPDSSPLIGVWSKLEAYAARLSLIVHLIRSVSEDGVSDEEVDEVSLGMGIRLLDYFVSIR